MSSPTPDDYVGLKSPWKPVAGPRAEFATKNATSHHHRIEIDHGSNDGDRAQTDSIGASNGHDAITHWKDNYDTHYDAQSEDVEVTETDSDVSNAIGDGAQEPSEMEDSRDPDIDNSDIDDSVSDGDQIAAVDITDAENDAPQHIDTKCVAVSTCVANSGDHRKVVSHIFGRNKACTRDLPDDLWIYWCRKHYQRFKYRAEDAENWHTIQMGLVRNQLQTFEDWGEVRSWTINLRKAEQDALIKENKNGLTYKDYICWERFLVPYLGVGKTYAQVREVLNVVERKFNEPEYRHRDKKLKTFPGVEFLPARQKAKEVKKPVAKKGETVYKKITLDQPAFSRKTRANTELIKEMAAKKRQTSSHTPSSSGTPSKKVKSPDTDDASDTSPSTKKHKTSATDSAANDTNHHKRKSVDTDTVTTTQPFQRRSLLTKRRRLTRGYEKHGSEGEDTSFMEEAEREDTTFVEKSDDDDRTFLNDRRFKK